MSQINVAKLTMLETRYLSLPIEVREAIMLWGTKVRQGITSPITNPFPSNLPKDLGESFLALSPSEQDYLINISKDFNEKTKVMQKRR